MSELGTLLAQLRGRFEAAIAQAADEKALDDVRIAYLGRSGEVTALRRGIGQLPPQERPTAGKIINEAVEAMEASLAEKRAALERGKFDAEVSQTIDVTIAPIEPDRGSIHPIRRVIDDMCAYFVRHG